MKGDFPRFPDIEKELPLYEAAPCSITDIQVPVGGCVIVWLSSDFGLKEPDHLPQVLDEGFFLVLDSLLSED